MHWFTAMRCNQDETLRVAAESPQVSKRSDKRFLRRVASIFLAPEHAESQREDPALPAMNDFAESLSIPRQSAFYDLLVARKDFHSLSSGQRPRFRFQVRARQGFALIGLDATDHFWV